MTDNRFSLLEIDDNASPNTIPPAAPARLELRRGEGPGRAGEIDQAGRERAIATDDVAIKHGMARSEDTLYVWGTRGNWGDKAKNARAELAARPLVKDFAASVVEMIKDEDRRALVVKLPTLTYGADDRLRPTPGLMGAPMTSHAFRQLLARADAPAYSSGYLGNARLNGALRAPHVNEWLAQAMEVPHSDTKQKAPIEGVLLSKIHRGDRHFYAVVSGKYARYDLNQVTADVARSCPATSRGSLMYDPETTRWSMDATIGAEFEPVVGDVHRVALRVSGNDAGGGSISVGLFAERVRCLNFSKVHLSSKVKNRIRHVGADVGSQVRALLSVQAEALTDFAAVWREANEDAIIDGVDSSGGDARKVFAALIDKGYVDAPDGAELAVERFFGAWLKEPGAHRADYVNAITRAAHEAPWSSPWTAEKLEDQAGELLYNRVVIRADEI